MSPISRMPAASLRDRKPFLSVLLPVLLLAGLLLAGCGGGGDSDQDIVLAMVGDVEITSGYYENRLGKLEETELPRAEDGTPLDTATNEGKLEFLNTLISKEVMVLTAEELGFDQDPQIVMTRKTLVSYEAELTLWDVAIKEPANSISNEELEAFYANLGRSRECRYLITNFLEDAEAAREYALTGADWEDVVDKYHDGGESPTGVNEITVPFGRYNSDFEQGVFGPEIGGVTQPIKTIYGYWVLKIDGEKPGKKPLLEEAKAQILDTTRNRKIAKLKLDFRKLVQDEYEFKINEEALWIAFKGLPHDEQIFKPGTKEQTPKDELEPLQIPIADLDMVFYSYMNPKEGPRVFTLGDYKLTFDGMSVFARPKKASLLGGFRSKIEEALMPALMNFKAEQMGLFEHPEVVDRVDIRIEEMMVKKLYTELVNIDDRVTEEQIRAFWDEHSDEYQRPELRHGLLLIALNEAKAAEAHDALDGGATWRDVLLQFGTDKDNKSRGGRLEGIALNQDNPVSVAVFALEPGTMSAPFALDGGRFGVVQLDRIEEGGPYELAEINEAMGQRIRNTRQEEAFTSILDKWRAKFPVTIYEDKLEGLSSWEELTAVEVPENLVPRN